MIDGNAQKTPWAKRKRWTPGRKDSIRGIVIHTCEAPEIPQGAMNVAAWFTHPSAPAASAHFAVDDALIVRCVREEDTAWHAGPVNACTIGIELQGKAAQTAEGWADPYSQKVLANAAKLCRELCDRWGVLPARFSPAEIKSALACGGPLGIFGHCDQIAATGSGSHTDPGEAFPWDQFLAMVKGEPLATVAKKSLDSGKK